MPQDFGGRQQEPERNTFGARVVDFVGGGRHLRFAAAVHQRYLCAIAERTSRRIDRRVVAADDNDLPVLQ